MLPERALLAASLCPWFGGVILRTVCGPEESRRGRSLGLCGTGSRLRVVAFVAAALRRQALTFGLPT